MLCVVGERLETDNMGTLKIVVVPCGGRPASVTVVAGPPSTEYFAVVALCGSSWGT
jgi:hypothetical protein